MGVTVREKKKGDGVWWLFINHAGQRKAKRAGTGTAGKKSAEFAAVQLRAKLAAGDLGIFEQATATPKPQGATFQTYATTWLAESVAPHRKARTHDYYDQVLRLHILPTFGKLMLTEIKPAHVRSFIAEKIQGGAGRNTVKNMAATLRAVLYQAQVDQLIASNPAARFGRFFDTRHDPRKHV